VLVSRGFVKLSSSRYAELRAKLLELITAFTREPDERGVDTEIAVALFTNEREDTGSRSVAGGKRAAAAKVRPA